MVAVTSAETVGVEFEVSVVFVIYDLSVYCKKRKIRILTSTIASRVASYFN